MIGRFVGSGFAAARDFLARGLVAVGVTPNTLTLVGAVLTAGAGVCLGIGAGDGFAPSLRPNAGASLYPLLAGGLLVLASACDMLDGAVARIGRKSTRFGAFLDSTIDRFSDFAVYAGLGAYYARTETANVTFVLLAMIAFFAAFMISYTRARAEDLIDRCRVGYWQRGERSTAVLVGVFAHNAPALLVQQAALPLLTVLRRVLHTRAVLSGRSPLTDPRQGGWWLKARLWRWPRMTIPYDLVAAVNMGWLVFARFQPADVLRMLFAG